MSDKVTSRLWSLRGLGNLLAVLALLLIVDLGWAWWNGTGTRACAGAWALAAESTRLLIGMVGLVIAGIGVMLGGARHRVTVLGIIVMAAGLILSGTSPALLEGVCGAP